MLLAPLSLALASSSLLAAQAGPAGSIHGTVLDPSGGAVANAAVQVASAAGMALTATTNATGAYNLNNVPAG
ncbi:carboxypeptidase regulatory-like domain-containing protein, partial [Lacticaseibacillus rhamnosus]